MTKKQKTIEKIGMAFLVIPILTAIIYGLVKAFMLNIELGIIIVLGGMFFLGYLLLIISNDIN